MATSTTIPTKQKKGQVINAGPQTKFDNDVLKMILVIAGSGAPDCSKTGIQMVSDVLATNTEIGAGGGYSRVTLSGVTVAFDGSLTDTVDFSFTAITYTQNAGGFTTARYGIIANTTIGAGDSTNPVQAVLDLGAAVGNVAGDLVLTPPTGGLIRWS